MLEEAEGQEAVLKYIPSEDVRDRVRSRWAANRPRPGDADEINLQRWQALEQECEKVGMPA